ncbi:MAG: sporulation protein YqfD, partial [Oscillospiraceae bacterium]
ILNVLEHSGVYIGSYWPKFTSDNIRSKVLVEIPELKWISVSVFGSRALIEVRERTDIPELFDEDEAVKIVAYESGIIESMGVLRGFPLFKKGQAALADETLISGAVPSSFRETELVHAEGSVIAHTWYELSAIMPLRYEEKAYTGEKKSRFALIFGNDRINFYGKSRIFDIDCDNIVSEHRLGIRGFFELPVTVIKETAKAYELHDADFPEDAAKSRLEALVNDELMRKIGSDGEIISSEYTFSVVNGFAVGTLRAECVQNIAAEKEMSAEEISEAKAPKEEKES